MKINRNMSAVMTNTQLLRTENKLSASMERLSSGLKINSPGDNPSGMAISNKMKAQIKALDQDQDNIADGISVMQIADSALNETTSILQRIRELSVQAANDTNSDSDRESIQAEIDQLVEEVDRISTDTEYNEKTLLDGSSDTRVYSSVKNGGTDVVRDDVSRINISDDVAVGNYDFTIDQPAEKATVALSLPSDITEDTTVTINGQSASLQAGMSDNDYLEQIKTAAEAGGCEVEAEYDAAGSLSSLTLIQKYAGSTEEISLDIEKTASGTKTSNIYSGTDAQITLDTDSFSDTATYHAKGNRVTITDQNGFSMDFLIDDNAQAGDEVDLNVTDVGPMVIHVGANENQTIDVRIPETSSKTLYLDTVNVVEYNGASRAMTTLDEAISYVNSVRSRVGAYQNRLEYANNSTSATDEDMTSAYSTLIDTDMAEEMTEYTQQNVLEQAAISVLSQANDLPQQVLSLLS